MTEGNLAVAPDWRSEVSDRLKAYRARHKRPGTDPGQPELLFDVEDAATRGEATTAGDSEAIVEEEDARANEAAASTVRPAEPRSLTRRPPGPQEGRPPLHRLEIDIAQPSFDFDGGARASSSHWDTPRRNLDGSWKESPESQIYPVAPLAQRRLAGLLDAALLLFSYGAFLSLFAALGGRFAFSKVDLAVVASTVVLFYALYVAVFTFFGGATPGLMLCHLRVISFDGSDPTPGQLLWRSFGYLISAGTLLFGFLAALWDEDALCWHDRISQTYLTPESASPVSSSGKNT